MLHRLFGSNRPIVLITLVLPALIVGILAGRYASPPSIIFGGPVFDLLYPYLSTYPIVLIASGLALTLVNAGILNSIFNRHGFASREHFLPALVFFFFSISDLSWVYLNPVHFANLFVLLGLRRLLTVYRMATPTRMLFDSGVFLGLGTLFFPMLVFAVPVLWLGLIQLRTFDLREWIIPLFGLLTPAVYVLVGYWWVSSWPEIDEFILTDIREIGFSFSGRHALTYPFLVITAVVGLMGFLQFISDMNVSTVHRKNSKAVFIWFSILVVLLCIYASGLQVVQSGLLGMLAAPVAIYAGIFFSGAKRTMILHTLFYLWLIFSVVHLLFTGVI